MLQCVALFFSFYKKKKENKQKNNNKRLLFLKSMLSLHDLLVCVVCEYAMIKQFDTVKRSKMIQIF